MDNKRFVVAGTHIGDRQDPDWKPQAGTHIAAKMIADKLNTLHNDAQYYMDEANMLEEELCYEQFGGEYE